MSAARVLITPKWIVGHILALTLIVLFVTLGLWQLERLQHRARSNQLIEQRLSARPLALQEVLASSGSGLEGFEFRRVAATGEFRPEHEILLRSRSRSGEAGRHVLTPLLQENGRAVLVDRGWVPYRIDEVPVERATPPQGRVEVEGLMRLEQDPPQGWVARLAPRDRAQGELESAFYIDVDRLEAQIPFPLEPVYLVLAAQRPAQPRDLPLTPEPPDLQRGSHLSYALQWFSFALIGLVGYTLLLRRTAQGR